MPVTQLGERLEAERAARGLTLTEFARDVLGIDQSLASRYVNGRQLPGMRNQRKIRDRLGIPPAEFEALIAASESPAAPESPARELIRATVQETLAQMGHPRVAITLEQAFQTVQEAIEALSPDEQDALFPPSFRDGVRRVRRHVLADEPHDPASTG